MKKGFTLAELLVVIAIIIIVLLVIYSNFYKRKGYSELDSTTKQIVALLREAQSNAMAQNKDLEWGVYFENTSTSFYALFNTTSYSTTTSVKRYFLPSSVRYSPSIIPLGGNLMVYFNKGTGLPSTSTSIVLELYVSGQVLSSSTIRVNSSGLISY